MTIETIKGLSSNLRHMRWDPKPKWVKTGAHSKDICKVVTALN